MGRLFMDPLDDPFAALDRNSARPLAEVADAAIIDVHAEATSEKEALAHYLDGRVSLVVGTHTHVPTADHRVMRGGTATFPMPACAGITTPFSECRRGIDPPLSPEDSRPAHGAGARRGHPVGGRGGNG